MECFKCHHINEPHAKFCSNCGKNFQAKKNNVNNKPKVNGMSSVYPNTEAVALHEAKLKERALNPILVIVFYSIILGFVFLITQDILGFAVGAFFVGIFFVVSFFATKNVTQEYYYTIPTSKDSEGNHRCIFCGNKGIYKSTIYKTNTVVNACSKCQKPLFRN